VTSKAARLHVEIDGRPAEMPEGITVLAALRRLGIDVPALCHDDRLTPTGECRSCLVHVAGMARLVPACTTRLSEGMEVQTSTPELTAYRHVLVSSLARTYPAGAVEEHPGKPFHGALAALGLTGTAAASGEPVDRTNPFLVVDMSRCIECYRCVRICDELQGQFVWHVRDRGSRTAIRPDGPTLGESGCVSCGACADTCPTGAIDDKDAPASAALLRWTRTTCPYCGTGCELMAGAADGRIVTVRPVLDAPVSRGHLCVKGRYGFHFVSAPDRVTEPMIRVAGRWKPVAWDDAIGIVAERLRRLIHRHGPDSIGMLGSARATNEDNYVAQKFARAVIGTNNVDCCARVCHAPSAAGLKQMLGAGLATGSFDDIEQAATILLCGANPTENHPIVGARIKQAVRGGAALVVIDPRRIELAAWADVHLALRPGTNVALLNAIAHTILAEDLADHSWLDARVDDLSPFADFVGRWTPERAAGICGVPAEDIRRAARLVAARGPTLSFHGLGLTEHVQGTEGVMALINLALLTGNLGKPGAGVNPLRGQNNVQGAAHMGCDPAVLPGSIPLEAGRAAFEAAWGCALPTTPGLHLMRMMDAAIAGGLKGLWVIGYDVLLTNPAAADTRRALDALDLLIVQDLFFTETARDHADIFLPACSSFEKDGTFMNAERRIQRVRRASDPLGHSRPDWAIVRDVARSLGKGSTFEFDGPEAIWDEVRAVCRGARGMTYSRLARAGLQWPCVSEEDPGAVRLHADAFASGPRAALRCIEPAPALEGSQERPFVLVTGRSLYQFNANTMTARTPIVELRRHDWLEMAPGDAERLGLKTGDFARVASDHGTAVLPVHVTARVSPGQLFATFHTRESFLNQVTGPERDPFTGTPAYKCTAVTVARLGPMRDHTLDAAPARVEPATSSRRTS
jgi:formate dehydrogenase major subunit